VKICKDGSGLSRLDEVVPDKDPHGDEFALAFCRPPVHRPHGLVDRLIEAKTCPSSDLRSQDLPVVVKIDSEVDGRRDAVEMGFPKARP
jgi:hypothetical protein